MNTQNGALRATLPFYIYKLPFGDIIDTQRKSSHFEKNSQEPITQRFPGQTESVGLVLS
jgi:hypothetical protein